jgi:hypothetical protein
MSAIRYRDGSKFSWRGRAGWKISQIMPDAGPRGWLTPTAWNLLHPTRLALRV